MEIIFQKYFRLFPDVIYKEGAGGGAIYMLTRSKILAVDPQKSELLNLLEKNHPVTEAATRVRMKLQEAQSFLKTLAVLKAGCFMQHISYIEKIRAVDPIQEIAFFQPPPTIRLLHIILGSRCSQKCTFCGSETFTRRLHPCMSCWKSDLPEKPSRGHVIEKTLEEASVLQANRLMLHAGDTDPVENLLARSVEAAKKFDYQSIELMTGTAVADHILDILITNRVVPVYQIFSSRPSGHDRVTRTDGSFERLRANFEMLRKKGGRFKLAYLHTGIDAQPEKEVLSLKKFGSQHIYTDRLLNEDTLKSNFVYKAHVLRAPDITFYTESKNTKSCLSGRLALGADGKYYPCPLLKNHPLGNASTTPLQSLFANGKIQKYWDSTGENESICFSCEYQYGCYQCRMITALHDDKKMICGYDPASGFS